MKVTMPNGGTEVVVDVPDRNVVGVFYPRELPVIEDQVAAARKAVENPIASPRLSELVRPNFKVNFLCDNWNRPIKHYNLLPPILEELKRSGVKDDNISFILGNGVHRRAFKEDIERLFGPDYSQRYQIENNLRSSRHILMGVTPTCATPVWVHELAAQADINIGLGALGYNPFAGYGGGAKIICPGCVSFETINYNHRLALSPRNQTGYAESPMRTDAEEMAPIINFKFIVNALYNKEGKLIKVVAGDPIAAHREGTKAADAYFGHRLPEPVDILVASANPRHTLLGAPITDMLWAVMMTHEAVKKGGTMIFTHLSPWPEHPICHTRCTWWEECERMFVMHGPGRVEEVMRGIHQGRIPGWYGPSIVAISKFMEEKDIYIVNERFRPDHLAGSGWKYAETVEDALKEALRKSGPDARIAVVPHGGRMTYMTARQEAKIPVAAAA